MCIRDRRCTPWRHPERCRRCVHVYPCLRISLCPALLSRLTLLCNARRGGAPDMNWPKRRFRLCVADGDLGNYIESLPATRVIYKVAHLAAKKSPPCEGRVGDRGTTFVRHPRNANWTQHCICAILCVPIYADFFCTRGSACVSLGGLLTTADHGLSCHAS